MQSRVANAPMVGAPPNAAPSGYNVEVTSLATDGRHVVEDLERSVRRILEFCDLKFEPVCLEFYKLDRSVATASSEQVRQPVFREGLLQWRNFEPCLGPLKCHLDDALVRYRE